MPVFAPYPRQEQDIYHKSPEKLETGHFDLEYLQGFCKYFEDVRNNKSVTINNRIAAIKSFLHYVSEMEPEYSAVAKCALMLPAQKYKQPTMDFLTRTEFDSMSAVCDTTTFIGARDKLMLMLLYNSGSRVSELLAIKQADIRKLDSASHASLKLYYREKAESNARYHFGKVQPYI